MSRLDALLSDKARERSEALVEVEVGRSFRWCDVWQESRRRAGLLEMAGVSRGDRVGLCLHRGSELFFWLMAVWLQGAVVVLLDPAAPEAELHGLSGHAQLKLLVQAGGGADYLDLSDGSGLLEAGGLLLRRPGQLELPTSLADEALILYTSGSTGNPKGVRHTHASIFASASGLSRRVFGGCPRRVLSVLPLHFSHGLFTHALSVLVHGGTLILAPTLDLFSAGRLWALAQEQRADFFSAVPAHYRLLIRASPGSPPPALQLGSASAPLEVDLSEEIKARWGRRLPSHFGMTETAGWCLYSGPGAPEGSIGRPGGCSLRVEDGELWLSGPAVSPGYWRNVDEDLRSRVGGWFRTGDLVELDDSGWVHYRGRLKRTFKVAGTSVCPEVIEAVLSGHPEVDACSVVSVSDPIYGELPRAFVVLAPGASVTVSELTSYLVMRLPPSHRPRWIEPLSGLPTTRSGKPDLPALAARALQQSPGQLGSGRDGGL